jgi:hypothetical protein
MQRCLSASRNSRLQEARKQARATLHPSLRDTFDRLLEDYEVSATLHAGEHYDTIADLVRAGWRRALP